MVQGLGPVLMLTHSSFQPCWSSQFQERQHWSEPCFGVPPTRSDASSSRAAGAVSMPQGQYQEGHLEHQALVFLRKPVSIIRKESWMQIQYSQFLFAFPFKSTPHLIFIQIWFEEEYAAIYHGIYQTNNIRIAVFSWQTLKALDRKQSDRTKH